MWFRWLWAFSLSFTLANCGSTNRFEDSGEKTVDEKIRIALDAGDLATARLLLEDVVRDDPTNYQRFVLLSAVYASLGGLDLTGALKPKGSGTGSAIDTISTILPATTTAADLDLMQKAVNQIKAIPDDKRQTTSTERYSTSAVVQLALYQAAFGVMFLRQFIAVTPDNKYDPDKLRTMTAADADVILGRLGEAAVGSPYEEKVKSTLAAVDATEGADKREKLINYMEAQKK